MRVKKRVERFVKVQIARYVGGLVYFAGLTALLPLLPLLLRPERVVAAKLAFFIALGLIFSGFLVVYLLTESRKAALRTLGFTTLVPGLIAVLFSYLGPRRTSIFLDRFGMLSPFVDEWVSEYVPTAWFLAGIYIILGVAFIWLSEKSRR